MKMKKFACRYYNNGQLLSEKAAACYNYVKLQGILNRFSRKSHHRFCDGCLHPRSDIARPLDARKTHQEFLRRRKNVVVQRGKREPPVWSKAHSARRTRCGFSREPARYDSPHPLNSTAHSAPAILLSVGRACPRPPQAGYARNVRSAPKIISFQQNSRYARTIPIKSRPAACTSGGINNFPLKRKGRP